MSDRYNYDKYTLHIRQYVLSSLSGMAGAALVMVIFYRSIWMVSLACVGGGIFAPLYYKRYLIDKRKRKLREEFKDALYSLIVSLRAGRSLEGAFVASIEDMDAEMMPYMHHEWKEIISQLQVGIPVEEGLQEFGQRSGVEEIQSFARTVEVCKRSEGDIAKVMENTIDLLQERMEIQMELKVILAKKKTEQKILNVMPFMISGLLLLLSPDYCEYNSRAAAFRMDDILPEKRRIFKGKVEAGELGVSGFAACRKDSCRSYTHFRKENAKAADLFHFMSAYQ